jgi:hypothetical protein
MKVGSTTKGISGKIMGDLTNCVKEFESSLLSQEEPVSASQEQRDVVKSVI